MHFTRDLWEMEDNHLKLNYWTSGILQICSSSPLTNAMENGNCKNKVKKVLSFLHCYVNLRHIDREIINSQAYRSYHFRICRQITYEWSIFINSHMIWLANYHVNGNIPLTAVSFQFKVIIVSNKLKFLRILFHGINKKFNQLRKLYLIF